MNKLTIVVSGKKQAGKNTACNYIISKFFNKLLGTDSPISYTVDLNFGHLMVKTKPRVFEPVLKIDSLNAKVYSFADPLKRFCIDVLGAPEESCYGTDEQKNTPIPHLLWENLPFSVIPIKPNSKGLLTHASGPMTGRELMQIIGTDLCRKFYGDCWAVGTFNTIKREGIPLALVCDGRFPNEIDMSKVVNAKTIRLQRAPFKDDTHFSETALDNYPSSRYSLVVENSHMSIKEQCEFLDPHIDAWFEEAGL